MVTLAIIWRVWFVVTALLLLNSLSGFVFNPTKKQARDTLKSLPFIAVWFLAIFSARGRKQLFKRAKKL